jgi:hypothetical protein
LDDVNEIRRLRSRVESLEAENGRLARALSEHATEARGAAASSLARARLIEERRQLEEMTAAYAAAGARAESAERQLAAITSSPSWWITAPLRVLVRRLRRSSS